MGEKKNPKTIIFLEFIDETEIFISKFKKKLAQKSNEITIITFHPCVNAYLKSKNISFVESFHFCKKENHQKLIQALQVFTEKIRHNCSLKDDNGIKNSYTENLIFHLRAILSHILYRIEVISEAIEQYDPSNIINIIPDKHYTSKSLFVGDKERYIDQIVSYVTEHNNIEMTKLSITMPKNIRNSISPLSNIVKEMVRFLIESAAAYGYKKKGKLVMAPSTSFQMGTLLKELGEQSIGKTDYGVMQLDLNNAFKFFIKQLLNIKTDFLYLPLIKYKKLDRNFIEIKETFNDTFHRLVDDWSYRGVNIGMFIKKKYQKALEPLIIDETRRGSARLAQYFKRFMPDFVIAQYSRMMSAILGEFTEQKNIPSLIIPHGSFTPSTDHYSSLEWSENALGLINSSYGSIALQTPLTERYLKEENIKKDTVVTGPLIFGRKIKTNETLRQKYIDGSEQDTKIILHAGTPKTRSGQRFINYETIDEYVDGIIALINTTYFIKNIHLIIRFREIDGLDKGTLKGLLPDGTHYSIASDGEFHDYLSISDLLVSFSSTTIEEALQNNIPVLLYNKYGRYIHIQGVELTQKKIQSLKPSAVYNINSQNDIYFGLNWIVTHHIQKGIKSNNLFKQYKYDNQKTEKLLNFIENNF